MPSPRTGSFQARAFACRSDSLPRSSCLDLVSDKPNRWNVEGEPTVYLSGDPALALVESGRHPADIETKVRVMEVDLRIPRIVDLRARDVRAKLGLPQDADWVLDRERTRQVARTLRHSGTCDGMLVPSVGALDQPERFNVVLFADEVARVSRMVTNPRTVGSLTLDDEPG